MQNRSDSNAEKHLPYFETLEALKGPGCALCFIVCDRVRKYLDHLIYEGITDPDFREQFNRDRGFCLQHTRQFMESGDGLAVGLTHRDVLASLVRELQSEHSSPPVDRRTKPCGICRVMEETEARHIKVLTKYLEEPEAKAALMKSTGFCWPHYEKLSRTWKPIPGWFRQFQIRRYEELLAKLDLYIDSQNIKPDQPRRVLNQDQKLVWKQTVHALFGDALFLGIDRAGPA